MKANSLENLIADQLFKIKKANVDISNYLIDCGSPFNQTDQKVPNGIGGRLES